jgi:CDP-diacylglycerol pyrophosphatase
VDFPAGQLALGVNAARTAAKPSRRVCDQDQLHIHLAGIRKNVVDQLKPITGGVQQWKSMIVDVTVGGKKYAYRGFRAPSFNENFFKLLHDGVVKPADEDMTTQMIIVTKSDGNDWYVLNSNSALRGPNNTGGTSTCDRLLVYT